ncbi:Gustatory receptor 64e [Carabus blaptoides fortunei]
MPEKLFTMQPMKKPLKNNFINPDGLNLPPVHSIPDPQSTLQAILKLPLIVAQCCGLFPLCGVTDTSANDLYFTWMAWRTLSCIFSICGSIVMAVFFYYWISMRGLRLENLGSLVFYSTSLFCTILFFKLARVWPKLAQEWQRLEMKFSDYPAVKNKPIKYKIILGVILVVAFVEHSLAVAISFGWISKCTDENLGVNHIKADFPQWFCFVEYNHMKAILVEYFNWVSTFNWNYNDIFIILVSEVLTEKFRQINERIRQAQNNIVGEHFYRMIRIDYTQLSHLCTSLNEAICHLITLSFMSNIMHICIQLYNILRPRETLVEYIYFYFSLGFLLARAVSVSLYASGINDESKVPLTLLHYVSSISYNNEVSRLIQQIHALPIALTGSNFFPVTRNLLISVGGTIIAYELVLIQLPRPLTKADLFLRNATDAQKIAYMCNVSRLCER